MKKLICLTLFLVFGCSRIDNQKISFLDFKLGMPYYEYNHLISKYLKEGVLQEKIIKEPYEHKRVLIYKCNVIKRDGILEPIFYTDRLDSFRIFFGQALGYEQNEEISTKEYSEILEKLELEYGQPIENHKDPDTEHRQAIWETENFTVSAAFVPESELSSDHISIIYKPIGDLELELEKYNEEKKSQREQQNY
ncbi:hypothetical protein [Pontibacter beigongshangensis]|uniref:hypothetical protein n=1 Tax=Pontibacter beigongshangensis TaxID=2574733 RepID=UPI00164F3A13|nr:hypothetical protein [Pontibacter beigongshangensis]